MNKILLAIALSVLTNPAFSQDKESQNDHPRAHDHETETNSKVHIEKKENAEHPEESHQEHATHDAHPSGASHLHDEHQGQLDRGHDNENNAHGSHKDINSTTLKPEQIKLADIQVELLTAQRVNYQLYAPGEILSNDYTSYSVSPRVASIVLRRHVSLGDHVKSGQRLVTLFSESVAEEQTNYRVAWTEWQRLQKLGRKNVGEQRYISAKSTLEKAEAKLLSYGLSKANLQSLTSQKSASLGEYTLNAEIDGVVLSDKFKQGQRIGAGQPLISLADEKQLWVEAQLPANMNLNLEKGAQAEVVIGMMHVKASVIQESHTIDSVTRTRTVRLLVNNPAHRLHPGQFAEVYFHFSTQQPVLAVPETALMRSEDGDWVVFMEEHPGEFKPVEVQLGRALGPLREIIGIEPGQHIVTQGAFFCCVSDRQGRF